MAFHHSPKKNIPVLRPKLPSRFELEPLLDSIDNCRIYSNNGPLVTRFEKQLSDHFSMPERTVATVANGTVGLTVSLLSLKAKPGSLCIIPAWTFIASVHAVIGAGLIPYFVDVEIDSWSLNPEHVLEMISRAPFDVGAVMVVSPFGRPLDTEKWDSFTDLTGVPVVIDAAAGFESLSGVFNTPTVVSMHATKSLGIGEGGFVISGNKSFIEKIRQASNFGFNLSKNVIMSGTNAKLSEYQAAIGLAALKNWEEIKDEWYKVAETYISELGGSQFFELQPGFGISWISSSLVISSKNNKSCISLDQVLSRGVETRKWWGNGAHNQDFTKQFPRGCLQNTETLAMSTFGIPFYRDLSAEEISYVSETLEHIASI